MNIYKSKHKPWIKVIALAVACLFTINDLSYGLSAAYTSPNGFGGKPDVQREMYAAGQKRFAAKIGPGAIDFDDYKPSEFTGKVPPIEDVNFVPADYDKLPEGWENSPILQETDLIEAFKCFRDNEAKIPTEKLDIQEGYFEADETSGELPIARIEQHGDKYVLIVHTKFVQMWNHIRANDVWFKTDIAGQKRTVSLAWGIFYRIAKHEMTDLVKAGTITSDSMDRRGFPTPLAGLESPAYPRPFKSLGYLGMLAGEFNVEKDEETANTIGGKYAGYNDAIWMWFLQSYAFFDVTRYNNNIFIRRLNWLFEDAEARKLNLNEEFPVQDKNLAERAKAITLASAINYHFFSRKGIEVPKFTVSSELKEEYQNRKPTRTEQPVYVIDYLEEQQPQTVTPQNVDGKTLLPSSIASGRAEGFFAFITNAVEKEYHGSSIKEKLFFTGTLVFIFLQFCFVNLHVYIHEMGHYLFSFLTPNVVSRYIEFDYFKNTPLVIEGTTYLKFDPPFRSEFFSLCSHAAGSAAEYIAGVIAMCLAYKMYKKNKPRYALYAFVASLALNFAVLRYTFDGFISYERVTSDLRSLSYALPGDEVAIAVTGHDWINFISEVYVHPSAPFIFFAACFAILLSHAEQFSQRSIKTTIKEGISSTMRRLRLYKSTWTALVLFIFLSFPAININFPDRFGIKVFTSGKALAAQTLSEPLKENSSDDNKVKEDVQARVIPILNEILSDFDEGNLRFLYHTQEIIDAIEGIKSDLLDLNFYLVEDEIDTRVMVIKSDGSLLINGKSLNMLSDEEVSSVIIHESVHRLPHQRAVIEAQAKRLDSLMLYKPYEYQERSEKGEILRRFLKRNVAVQVALEQEAYAFQHGYLTYLAVEKHGFRDFKEYYDTLVASGKLMGDDDTMASFAKYSADGGGFYEEFREILINEFLNKNSSEIKIVKQLLLASAFLEGVDIDNKRDVAYWQFSWLVDPKYNNFNTDDTEPVFPAEKKRGIFVLIAGIAAALSGLFTYLRYRQKLRKMEEDKKKDNGKKKSKGKKKGGKKPPRNTMGTNTPGPNEPRNGGLNAQQKAELAKRQASSVIANSSEVSPVIARSEATKQSQNPVILNNIDRDITFVKGSKRVVFPKEMLERLEHMVRIARDLHVELMAKCHVKDGKVIRVDYPDDLNKIAVLTADPTLANIRNEVTFFRRNYSAFNYLKYDTARLNIQKARLIDSLRKYVAVINLYSPVRKERIDLTADNIPNIDDDELVKIASEVRYMATEWWGSVDLEPDESRRSAWELKQQGGEIIEIHNHPVTHASPPSAITDKDGNIVAGDLATSSFFGSVNGLVLHTPEGEELFLLYEPDESNKQSYIDMFRKFWTHKQSILQDLRQLAMTPNDDEGIDFLGMMFNPFIAVASLLSGKPYKEYLTIDGKTKRNLILNDAVAAFKHKGAAVLAASLLAFLLALPIASLTNSLISNSGTQPGGVRRMMAPDGTYTIIYEGLEKEDYLHFKLRIVTEYDTNGAIKHTIEYDANGVITNVSGNISLFEKCKMILESQVEARYNSIKRRLERIKKKIGISPTNKGSGAWLPYKWYVRYIAPLETPVSFAAGCGLGTSLAQGLGLTQFAGIWFSAVLVPVVFLAGHLIRFFIELQGGKDKLTAFAGAFNHNVFALTGLTGIFSMATLLTVGIFSPYTLLAVAVLTYWHFNLNKGYFLSGEISSNEDDETAGKSATTQTGALVDGEIITDLRALLSSLEQFQFPGAPVTLRGVIESQPYPDYKLPVFNERFTRDVFEAQREIAFAGFNKENPISREEARRAIREAAEKYFPGRGDEMARFFDEKGGKAARTRMIHMLWEKEDVLKKESGSDGYAPYPLLHHAEKEWRIINALINDRSDFRDGTSVPHVDTEEVLRNYRKYFGAEFAEIKHNKTAINFMAHFLLLHDLGKYGLGELGHEKRTEAILDSVFMQDYFGFSAAEKNLLKRVCGFHTQIEWIDRKEYEEEFKDIIEQTLREGFFNKKDLLGILQIWIVFRPSEIVQAEDFPFVSEADFEHLLHIYKKAEHIIQNAERLSSIEDHPLIRVISEYAAHIGVNIGPGTISREEVQRVWGAVNLLHENRIEILAPQSIGLTETMQRAIKGIKKREGADAIGIKEYSGKDHLARLLGQKTAPGIKRIIITDEGLSEEVASLAEENPELFRDKRLLNIALPANYGTMDQDQKTIHQARVIMLAILARLLEKGKTSMVEALLKELLKDHLGEGNDLNDFIDKLGTQEEETTDRDQIKARILYFLGKTVSLIEQLDRELKFIKEFWTAA